MVSIKEAFQNAVAFAQDALGPVRSSDARLEEVDSTDVGGEDAWLITLSVRNPDPLMGLSLNAKRDYKIFTVLKRNGEVKAMRIRELADA
jgi:hypothetical protein